MAANIYNAYYSMKSKGFLEILSCSFMEKTQINCPFCRKFYEPESIKPLKEWTRGLNAHIATQCIEYILGAKRWKEGIQIK